MKKSFMFLLITIIILYLLGCNKTKSEKVYSVNQEDPEYILNNNYQATAKVLTTDQKKLIYNYYKETGNMIYSINKLFYPSFLESRSFKEEYINTNKYIINTNIYVNEDFLIEDLIPVDKKLSIYEKQFYLEQNTYIALVNLFNDAKKHNITLLLFSAYRSYDYQEKLYNQKENNPYVAKPGESEHHTGKAVDIGTEKLGLITDLDNTKEGRYLKNNAYKFGFILRYDKGKENITGYPYEAWHYRYIGIKEAYIVKSKKITYEEFVYTNYLIMHQ